MKVRETLLLFFLAASLALFPSWLLSQDTEEARAAFAAPHHEAQAPALLDSGFNYWNNGYLITYARGGALAVSRDKPGVVLYDKDGRVAREALVWLDGARSVSVSDAAVSSSGQLVVSGGTDNDQGVIANFIGEVGADGHLRRVIRTTPFMPVYLCAAPDGTVWSYGIDRDEHLRGVQNSLRLRQFSFERGQLRALLDPSSLGQDWPLERGSYPGAVSLRCNSQTLVLYNADHGSLAELDLKTNSLKVTHVAALPAAGEFKILGFALTDSGQIFASFYDRSRKPALSGIFHLNRDDAAGARWVIVDGTAGPYLRGSAVERLLGSDGNDLVYTRLKDGKIYWSKQPEQ